MKQDVLDKLVLLLVSQVAGPALDEAAARLGVPAEKIPDTIAEARRRLTVAADYNRDEQIGTAFVRLNDLYRRSLAVQDVKTALAAQRELNKLLDLYRVTPERAVEVAEAEDDDNTELAAIREHLIPLGLAAADYPLREHARIAAEVVRDHQGKRDKREA